MNFKYFPKSSLLTYELYGGRVGVDADALRFIFLLKNLLVIDIDIQYDNDSYAIIMVRKEVDIV